jgi:hypothetical protein
MLGLPKISALRLQLTRLRFPGKFQCKIVRFPHDYGSLVKLFLSKDMFQFVNSQTNNCITMHDRKSVPTANVPRDFGAFSVNVSVQIWLVKGDAEGWYIIKSFPFGVALGTGSTPALMVGSSDGISSYQWKFIQDAKATTVRCVNRRFPSYVLAALDGAGTLQLVLDSATPMQRYSI